MLVFLLLSGIDAGAYPASGKVCIEGRETVERAVWTVYTCTQLTPSVGCRTEISQNGVCFIVVYKHPTAVSAPLNILAEHTSS